VPRRDELLPALLLILNWSDHFKSFQHLQDGDRLCDTSGDGEHHVSKVYMAWDVLWNAAKICLLTLNYTRCIWFGSSF